MLTKLDRSYDGFFNYLGFAVILCTLLVSVGKLITCYYFFYIITLLILILISLTIFDYYCVDDSKSIKVNEGGKDISEEYSPVKIKVEPPPPYCSPPDKTDPGLRRLVFLKNVSTKEDKMYLKVAPRDVQRHSSVKMLRGGKRDGEEFHTSNSLKGEQDILAKKETMGTSPIREIKLPSKKRLITRSAYAKEGRKPALETLI